MISYRPLFRFCVEHDIYKADCRKDCGISPNTWTKINQNKEVSLSVLTKICQTYKITYGDIVEYTHETQEEN